jgi:predicted DNA-binding transcriptional regulator YafY
MPLLPPTYNETAVRVVYDALLAGKRFTAHYRSRAQDTDEIKVCDVNPLGLVARGNLLYLVCTLWDYQDLRQLALHRIITAEATDTAVAQFPDFDLDRYIAEGEFQYPVGPTIQLKARFTREAAAHLYETPLSTDQTIEPAGADHVLVTASVRNTAQLDWWLRGFGDAVTVVHTSALPVQERTTNE